MLHLPLSGWLPGPNSQACKTLSACGTLQTPHVVRTLIINMCLLIEMNRPSKVAEETKALGLWEESVETLALVKLFLCPHLHS